MDWLYLDVSALVFEVDPRVRVAPDEESEKEARRGDGDQHENEAKEAAVTHSYQGSVVRSGEEQTYL